jgi:hypothetical protein
MEVVYSTGERKTARSVDLALDTVYPAITISTEYKLFSPNGDGRKDAVRIEQKSEPGDNWEGQILNARNVAVRSWAWKDKAESLLTGTAPTPRATACLMVSTAMS